jgi:hypothetical protein
VGRHLNTSKSGRFPTFSNRESNWQFDSRPFFWATIYVLRVMQAILDICVPRLSNDIRNSLIQWVSTPAITLWRLKSPLRLQLPKWEFTWECEGSFLHTFPQSRASLLACTFTSLCFSRNPKARVATKTCNMWKSLSILNLSSMFNWLNCWRSSRIFWLGLTNIWRGYHPK